MDSSQQLYLLLDISQETEFNQSQPQSINELFTNQSDENLQSPRIFHEQNMATTVNSPFALEKQERVQNNQNSRRRNTYYYNQDTDQTSSPDAFFHPDTNSEKLKFKLDVESHISLNLTQTCSFNDQEWIQEQNTKKKSNSISFKKIKQSQKSIQNQDDTKENQSLQDFEQIRGNDFKEQFEQQFEPLTKTNTHTLINNKNQNRTKNIKEPFIGPENLCGRCSNFTYHTTQQFGGHMSKKHTHESTKYRLKMEIRDRNAPSRTRTKIMKKHIACQMAIQLLQTQYNRDEF